jgi:hypothetical protein
MDKRSVLRSLTLAVLLGALVTVPASAQGRDDRRDRNRDGDSYYNYDRSSNAQFGLTRNPHWMKVRGTKVMVIRDQDRPDYDMFRFGRDYYVCSSGHWYRSTNWRGSFRPIDGAVLPGDFRKVPREYWRTFPSGWNDNGRMRHRDRNRDRDRDRDHDRNDGR